ncbi:MAG: translation initiation factor [Deltaproteobacteria bacterium]|nr:MAG: translation initiation factor [Deltaproteobacteria bacterium]
MRTWRQNCYGHRQPPKSDTFLKELCSELKKKCGTGGTHFISDTAGVVEIQGDKRDVIRALLLKKDFKVKG